MSQSTQSFQPAKKYKGSLEVICGSMFSGKTGELMKRLRRAELSKEKVLTIKHHIDIRSASHHCIVSHDGDERTAVAVDNSLLALEKILELATDEVDTIGIDEAQFFPQEIFHVITTLIERGKRVILSGLDLDFRGEPFSIMPVLLTIADSITKLNAVCTSCGKDAHFSQRIINGSPAKYDDPIILVGAAESYEARCRDCFIIDRSPDLSNHISHL